MGDGRSFDQALRQLDKLIAESSATSEAHQPEPDPIRRAYERIINAATPQQH